MPIFHAKLSLIALQSAVRNRVFPSQRVICRVKKNGKFAPSDEGRLAAARRGVGEEGFDVVVEKEGRKKFLEGEGRATVGREREAGRNFDGFFFLRFPLSAAAGGEMFFRRSPSPPPPFGKQLSARSGRRGEQEKKYRKFN